MSENQAIMIQSQNNLVDEKGGSTEKWDKIMKSSEDRFQKIQSLFDEIIILDSKIKKITRPPWLLAYNIEKISCLSWLFARKVEDLRARKKEDLSVIYEELAILYQEHNFLRKNCTDKNLLFELSVLITTREMAILNYASFSGTLSVIKNQEY